MELSSRIVLHCFVLIGLAAGCRCEESPLLPAGEVNWPIDSYLTIDKPSDKHLLGFDYVKDKVEGNNLTSAEEVKQFLDELKEEPDLHLIKHKGQFMPGYNLIANLANLAEGPEILNQGMKRDVINLIRAIYGSLNVMQLSGELPDHDVVLYNFLKQYSKIKFYKPMKDIIAEYELKMAHFQPKVQAELDGLIGCSDKAGYSSSIRENKKEEFLRRLAERMDFHGGHFDANCMTMIADKVYKRANYIPEGGSKLGWLVSAHCTGLWNRFGDILVNYNLLRLFNEESLEQVGIPAGLLKLNEYSRLCKQLWDPNTKQQTLENFGHSK